MHESSDNAPIYSNGEDTFRRFDPETEGRHIWKTINSSSIIDNRLKALYSLDWKLRHENRKPIKSPIVQFMSTQAA